MFPIAWETFLRCSPPRPAPQPLAAKLSFIGPPARVRPRSSLPVGSGTAGVPTQAPGRQTQESGPVHLGLAAQQHVSLAVREPSTKTTPRDSAVPLRAHQSGPCHEVSQPESSVHAAA